MADAEPKSDGTFGFLTHKAGPLPVWAWGLIGGVVIWYWYTHYGPGATTTGTTAKPAASPKVDVVEVRGARGARGKRGERGKPAKNANAGAQRIPTPKQDASGKGPARAAAQPAASPDVTVAASSPVYDSWTADESGVPDPQAAYAPMTAGATYG